LGDAISWDERESRLADVDERGFADRLRIVCWRDGRLRSAPLETNEVEMFSAGFGAHPTLWIGGASNVRYFPFLGRPTNVSENRKNAAYTTFLW
jgi:hypothetical protein